MSRPVLFGKEVNYFSFRHSVWLLSGSKESFYVFEKRYESVLLKMFSEGNSSDSVGGSL